MTSQTQQQTTSVAQSRYASKSVEEQGPALRRAAIDGELKNFTPADWAVFIDSGALGRKDNYQRLFLHYAAVRGCLDQIPHQVWEALIAQDLLKEEDDDQMHFLHKAAWRGHLDQIPPYVCAAMRPEQGYDADFWFGKDTYDHNILDLATFVCNGKHFPQALYLPLWQGRGPILQTLWRDMKDKRKEYPGVREAYQKFLLHPMLRVQKKVLVLK